MDEALNRPHPKTLAKRYWPLVDKQIGKRGACWLWRGKKRGGLSLFRFGERSLPANHIAWEKYRGELPAGHVVYPLCGEPSCVNPDHQKLSRFETEEEVDGAILRLTLRFKTLRDLAQEELAKKAAGK